jgi:hypothetical protein
MCWVQECNSEDFDKPTEGSEWVWTTYGVADTGEYLRGHSSPGVVQNVLGGMDAKSNIGCMWRCREGYVLDVRHSAGPKGVSFCVADV